MKNFDILRAVKCLDEGKLDSLINYCESILKEDNKSGKAYLFKAKAYNYLGKYEKANIVLAMGLEQCMNPDDRLELLSEQIETYSSMQNYERALDICTHALTIVPQEIDLLFAQAKLYYLNAMFNEALETLNKVKTFDTEELYKDDIIELNEKILEWLQD